ncbi:PIG-L family deacetylase [Pandoraea pnomenusa]|jgi:LmbE family N-acetylglucosaminyl deacetylase|uniref:PIG-L deacetylase family protein n=1 Tax=Pandoraea pnomenusa TaxID=93220 RepID=UPI001198BFE7|nr:PIG-L family deacetylase [Pandoraea pnomenusa]QDX21794.1 PIG-L family deacetylase [Pandoraea pnomenusa]
MTQRYPPEHWETSKWLVISPHLDDAVFSCGRLMAAAPGTVVVTVFAGVPPAGTPAPPWDRAAGFASGHEAMQARRLEDLSALDKLRAESVWLPFLDRQYVDAETSQAIAPALREILGEYPDRRVLAPLGLFHSDHALVFDAVWRLMHEPTHALAGDMPEAEASVAELDRWWFYEDMPYRRLAGLVAARIMAWRAQGYSARLAAPVAQDIASGQYAVDKVEAMQAYESQLGLLDPDALIDLNTSESYWQLQWSPVPH